MGGGRGWVPGSGFYLPLGHRQQCYIINDTRVPGISYRKVKLGLHENLLPIVDAVIQGKNNDLYSFYNPQDRPRHSTITSLLIPFTGFTVPIVHLHGLTRLVKNHL